MYNIGVVDKNQFYLIPILNTIKNVKAEEFIPFSEYTHLITNTKTLNGAKGKLIASDCVHRGVEYSPAVDVKPPITKVLAMVENDEDWIELRKMEHLFSYFTEKGVFLTIGLSDKCKERHLNGINPYILKDGNYDISDFQMILATSRHSILEAWVRKIPIICKEDFGLYEKAMSPILFPSDAIKDTCKPFDYRDFVNIFELYNMNFNALYVFLDHARTYVITHESAFLMAMKWMDVISK